MKTELKEYCGHFIKLVEFKKKLESTQLTKKLFDELFLNVHSVKSVTLALGHETLAREIHRFENFLSKVKINTEDTRRRILAQLDRINFKLKQRLVLEDIELKTYFKSLTKNIGDLAKKTITLRYHEEGEELSRAEVNFLREVISPIVINSIDHGIESLSKREKFGKKEKGKIGITIKADHAKLYVEVFDDGRGFDYRSNKELSLMSGRKLGLRFVSWQVEENSGEVKIESEKGLGSKVSFSCLRIYDDEKKYVA